MSTTHSQVIDAVDVRISSRSFNGDLIEDGLIHQLRQNIDAMALLSGVNFTLLENHPEIFSHAVNNYGIFEGAAHVIVLSGNAHDDESIEKAGFYGERLVLTATLMGLATCWVDNSIDMDLTAHIAHIEPSHTVFAAIVVGYFHDQKEVLEQSFEERESYQQEHRTNLPLSELSLSELTSNVPSWYLRALTALSKAPSPHNKQPIRLKFESAKSMSAHIEQSTRGSLLAKNPRNYIALYLALGIAKLHTHIGITSSQDDPRSGEWAWGDHASYALR